MSIKRPGRHTPRGIPIMDVINLPSDLPAPMTTRPLLSRTESLARSRTTSRANSVSSSATSVKSGASARKTMESGSSTMVKREEANPSNIRGPTGMSSTSRSNVRANEARKFVPSSESPEPMDFHPSSDQMMIDTEIQDPTPSASQGTKRKRFPTGDLEVGGSTTQAVTERETGSSSSTHSDESEAQLQDELDLIMSSPAWTGEGPPPFEEVPSSSTHIHHPDGSQRYGLSSGSRVVASGVMSDMRTNTNMNSESEGRQELDTSQSRADREDTIKVEMMLDANRKYPVEGRVPSSSTNQASNSGRVSNNYSTSSSSSPSPPPRRDKGKNRAKRESTRPPDSNDIIDITDSPPTPYRTLPPKRGHYSNKGKQKAEAVDLSFLDDDVQAGDGSSNTHSATDTPATEPTNSQNVEDDTHLSSYTCPICFCAPTNATLTPCGHICCGECLFTAIKTTQQRASVIGPIEDARCPVCRAVIPGWDGKGGGVIGLKIRAVFSL